MISVAYKNFIEHSSLGANSLRRRSCFEIIIVDSSVKEQLLITFSIFLSNGVVEMGTEQLFIELQKPSLNSVHARHC